MKEKKFYEMGRSERLSFVKRFSHLSDNDLKIIKHSRLPFNTADSMIENAIGVMPYPLGIATNFVINRKEYLIPMVIEEPSVVAAASKAAKIAKIKGGFKAEADESYMIGQIQVLNLKDPVTASQRVLEEKQRILELANKKSKTLSRMNAGAKDLTFKIIESEYGRMLIIELLIDVRDAMGANIINTMCESVAPVIEDITGGNVLLRILSNYATKRLVRVKAVFSREEIEDIDNIILAYAFAVNDKYRCVTHNKGVMNGVIAVAHATGQDTRAIEAAAHAYACKDGSYTSLTHWEKNNDGDLVGSIELPLAVGTVGGVVSVHPIVKVCMKILGVKSAKELAMVMASVGLAQNFAALKALASEGIQKGHMRLHARNVAMSAGAKGRLIDDVARIIAEENDVTLERAKKVLQKLKQNR